jgi:hypothetical protein
MSMLHIVLVDIDPAVEEEFNTWYDCVHIPQILTCPGWLSATRKICLEGGPKYAAIYEISGPEAYDTTEFKAISGFGRFETYVVNFHRIRLESLLQAATSYVGPLNELTAT